MRKIYYSVFVLAGACLMAGCKGENKSTEVASVAVRTEKAVLRPVDGMHHYSGTVEEESGSALSFMTAGTIRQIYVDQGQLVGSGALLAEVDETTLRNAYEATLATRRQAEDAYARMKRLHDNNSLPEMQWVEVQSKLEQAVAAEQIAKKSLSDSKLYAPYSGFIAAKTAEVGQNTVPGMPVLNIVKIDRVKVKVSVPESEIARIKKGDKMDIQVSALGGKTFSGVVTEKGVTAHPLSRSYDVKALVNNAGHDLLPGMICDVLLESADAGGQTAVVLPAGAIYTDSDNRTFVWIAADGKASKRTVSTGGQSALGVTVTAGLNGGEEVIVEGQQKVSEGMNVETTK